MNIIRFEKAELVDGKLSWSAIHNGYDYPDVKNKAIVGVLKWNMIISQYCYYPTNDWLHGQVVLSETLLNEIMEFINSLK